MYYLQVGILVLINAMLATGAYLPLSAGLMLMCMGTLMSVGAIVSAACHSSLGLPFPVAIFIGGLLAALAGGLIAVLCSRLIGFLFAVATLGLGELARVIVINTEALGGALGYKNVELTPPSEYLFYLLVAFGCCVVLLSFFEQSATRKLIAVLRDNEVVAASLGVNSLLHKAGVVAAGGFIAGVAGGFYIHSVGLLDPRFFGFESSLLIVTFAIIGGARNFWGAVIGATLLTVIPELLRFSSTYRMVLYGVALILVVILRPNGLLGVHRYRLRRFLPFAS
jgi:branched-chain amino acid transport system permease protein